MQDAEQIHFSLTSGSLPPSLLIRFKTASAPFHGMGLAPTLQRTYNGFTTKVK